MSIRDVSNLNVKTPQENEFVANLRAINSAVNPAVFQDKLVNSLGNDSFKSVLSDSKETDCVKAKVKSSSQNNSDKQDVKRTEKNVEKIDDKKAEKVLSDSASFFHQKLSQSAVIESDIFTAPLSSDFSAFDIDDLSLTKEFWESDNPFGVKQDAQQQLLLDDSMIRPVGFSESIAMQNLLAQTNHESKQAAGQESLSMSDGDTQIDMSPGRAVVNMHADQRMDAEALKNIQAEQKAGMPKIIISTTKPVQNMSPLVTPILISNYDSDNKSLFEIDSELGIDVGSTTTKPISFAESSQHQKQLLNKNTEDGMDDNPEKSFDGTDSHTQQVSANAADSVQRTVAVQKLTQIIRDRAQDAMDKSKNDMTINVKGIQTTLGEVELDLKINNKKISIRLSSESKDMQTLLTQERSKIVSILNGLIDSTAVSEYSLADIPVEVCHKEKEL